HRLFTLSLHDALPISSAFCTCGLLKRNTVRGVLDAEVKNGTLRLAVQRLGQSRPTKLEICRERDRRSPSARKVCRAAYEHKLRRDRKSTRLNSSHVSI